MGAWLIAALAVGQLAVWWSLRRRLVRVEHLARRAAEERSTISLKEPEVPDLPKRHAPR